MAVERRPRVIRIPVLVVPAPRGAPRGHFSDLEHLKEWQWKKGQSGNPSGKPKGIMPLSTAYKLGLAAEVPERFLDALQMPPGTTWEQAIACNLLQRAVGLNKPSDVDFAAITELREVTEGKVPDKLVTNTGNAELQALADALSGGPAATPASTPHETTRVSDDSGDSGTDIPEQPPQHTET